MFRMSRMFDEEGKVFFGGVPTDPEVQRLKDTYAIPEVGQVISYDEVAAVIGCDRKGARFKTVTLRWRSQMERDYGIIIGVRRGIGFVVLNPREKVGLSASKLEAGIKSIKRSNKVVSMVDRAELTDVEKHVADHIARVTSALTGAAILESKKVKFKLPAIQKKE